MSHTPDLTDRWDGAASRERAAPDGRWHSRLSGFLHWTLVMLRGLVLCLCLWMVLWALWMPSQFYRHMGEDPGNGSLPTLGYHADFGMLTWARRTEDWSWHRPDRIRWEFHLLPAVATLAATYLAAIVFFSLMRAWAIRWRDLGVYLVLSGFFAWYARAYLMYLEWERQWEEWY